MKVDVSQHLGKYNEEASACRFEVLVEAASGSNSCSIK